MHFFPAAPRSVIARNEVTKQSYVWTSRLLRSARNDIRKPESESPHFYHLSPVTLHLPLRGIACRQANSP